VAVFSLRIFLHKLLLKPVLWLTKRYSSNPDREEVFRALNELLKTIRKTPGKKGITIPFECSSGRFIIFSDMHKGGRNNADDFMKCEDNYLKALDYYHTMGFKLIALGDSEELWESTLSRVKKVHPKTFEKEKQFISGNAFIKIFGNHDLYWGNDPFAGLELKKIYDHDLPIYEGVILKTLVKDVTVSIYCTHGHQGDKLSDGNWFSKFFVARIWAPFQAYLNINPNTPAYDAQLKTKHNSIMYEWSARQKNLLLITGHTHQPAFESLTHLERLYRQLLLARQKEDESEIAKVEKEIEVRKWQYSNVSENYLQMKPTYFNSGCCCNDDGDITGIEIESGCIRLIKWNKKAGTPQREVLEEASLEELLM
jgi:hypothetical protein